LLDIDQQGEERATCEPIPCRSTQELRDHKLLQRLAEVTQSKADLEQALEKRHQQVT